MPQSCVVAALYKFVDLPDFEALRPGLLAFCRRQSIKGTLLLATEGINGTVAGSRAALDGLLAYLCADPRLADLAWQTSRAETPPFQRMKVKLKKEIVTLGRPGVRPAERAGRRVEPRQWNRLITDPAVVLIDTRNQYEHQIGTFENARSPETVNFREFPDYARVALDRRRDKKVAMFCTGGIRCEKASAYLLQQGFETVYQLKGGILNYLAEVEAQDSLWRGECFVFDTRVSVDHKLARGRYEQCFACRRPLSAADRRSAHYQPGVSCARCIGETTAARRAAFSERQHQVELAAQRRQRHLGERTPPAANRPAS